MSHGCCVMECLILNPTYYIIWIGSQSNRSTEWVRLMENNFSNFFFLRAADSIQNDVYFVQGYIPTLLAYKTSFNWCLIWGPLSLSLSSIRMKMKVMYFCIAVCVTPMLEICDLNIGLRRSFTIHAVQPSAQGEIQYAFCNCQWMSLQFVLEVLQAI